MQPVQYLKTDDASGAAVNVIEPPFGTEIPLQPDPVAVSQETPLPVTTAAPPPDVAIARA